MIRKSGTGYTYEIATGAIHNITAPIRVPLYDEEDDHPDDPPPHGSMGWLENDRYVYIYDKYDIWQCDPTGGSAPVNFTGGHRPSSSADLPVLSGLTGKTPPSIPDQWVLITVFNNRDKTRRHDPSPDGVAVS